MANFTVTNTNDSGAGSLRQAVLNSNARNGADRIVFDSSLAGSTINLTSGQLRITDSLTIEGLGAEDLTIDAGGNSRVFLVSDTSFAFASDIDFTIEDLTITGGSSLGNGGAIFAADTITNDINVTIFNSSITGNSATGNGGAIYFDSQQGGDDVRIINSQISENSATGGGGAIFAEELIIFGSTISGNTARIGGGGVLATGFVSAGRSIFQENTTEGFGGGLVGRNITLLASTISNNSAGLEGGGIRTEGAAIIIDSSIHENEAGENGGGISVAQLRDLSFLGGERSTLIANTTISGNEAEGNGGGIQVVGLQAALSSPFGVSIGANLVATNVTISNNIADSDNNGIGDGGGIYNFPFEVFEDETGRFQLVPGDITFSNSIIAGNFDTPNNDGIGFIAPDIDGAAIGNANNLLGSTQGLTVETLVAPAAESLGAGSDTISSDPGLGPLQDNGGFSLTHALLPDSPAINAGDNGRILRETLIDVRGIGRPPIFSFDGDPSTNNAQIPNDQRGVSFSRIVDGTVDIGAYEQQAAFTTNAIDDLIQEEAIVGLFDAETDTLIQNIEDGDVIDVAAESQSLTLVVTVTPTSPLFGEVESIFFNLNAGEIVRTENFEPYALFGDSDNGNDLRSGSGIPLGENTLSLDLYSENRAEGQLLDSISLNFVLV